MAALPGKTIQILVAAQPDVTFQPTSCWLQRGQSVEWESEFPFKVSFRRGSPLEVERRVVIDIPGNLRQDRRPGQLAYATAVCQVSATAAPKSYHYAAALILPGNALITVTGCPDIIVGGP